MADVGAFLFPTWTFYYVPWLLGALVAVLAAALGRPLHKAFGLALMTVPVWDTFWGILDAFGPLLQGGQVLGALTRHQLSGLYTYKFLADLGYLTFGVLLHASGGTWTGFWSQTPRSVAHHLAAIGLPMGRFIGRRGEGASAFAGLLLFPLLLIVTYGVNLLLSGFEVLRQSDESRLFANMTPYHAVVISLAAGFGEELLYRGFLQTALSRRLHVVAAIVLQAVFFGLAHSGYGTWIHVVLPTLFGLVAGLVAYAFGLWAAITLHVLVDVIAFGVEASVHYAWTIPALSGFLVANILLTLGWSVAMLVVWRMRRRRQARPS